jgi:hypothetical protein
MGDFLSNCDNGLKQFFGALYEMEWYKLKMIFKFGTLKIILFFTLKFV